MKKYKALSEKGECLAFCLLLGFIGKRGHKLEFEFVEFVHTVDFFLCFFVLAHALPYISVKDGIGEA